MPNTNVSAAPLVGRAHVLPSAPERLQGQDGGCDPEREKQRFLAAFARAGKRYATIHASTHNAAMAATLRFHAAILDDPDLRASIEDAIVSERLTAATAIEREFAAAIRAVGIPGGFIATRAEDFREVRDRVLDILLGLRPAARKLRFREPTIVVCERLSIACLSAFDPRNVVAVLAAAGGRNSHAAIVLATEGIPLVIDPALFLAVTDGEILAVPPSEEGTGTDPMSADVLFEDDASIVVAPAVNRLAETMRPGFAAFAGIGLFRTEFSVLGTGVFPDLETQTRDYRMIARAMPGKRVCFRLFDIEPDKCPAKRKPTVFGVRFLLAHPALLDDQLTALLLVAAEHAVDILVPMVEEPADMAAIARHFDVCAERVRELAGVPELHARLGAMVETAKAVANLPAFPRIAFVSIGSNDLSADLSGCARTDAGFDPALFHSEAFLTAVRAVSAFARERNLEASLCGAAADDAEAIVAAAAAGIRRFVPSVAAAYAVYPALRRRTPVAEALAKTPLHD